MSFINKEKEDRIFRITLHERFKSKDQLNLKEIHEVLVRYARLGPMDIDGMQQDGSMPKTWDVRVRSLEVWQEKCLDNIFGVVLPLYNGKYVTLDKAFQQLNSILVKNIPMSWEDGRLFKIFSFYGDIKRIEDDVWRQNRYIEESETYAGIHNGCHRITMKLLKSIPASLTIDGRRIEVHYRNQELSCWTCGKAHFRHNCKELWGNYINRFKMKEFEDAYEASQRKDDAHDENENDLNADTGKENTHGVTSEDAPGIEENTPGLTKEDIPANVEKEKENTHWETREDAPVAVTENTPGSTNEVVPAIEENTPGETCIITRDTEENAKIENTPEAEKEKITLENSENKIQENNENESFDITESDHEDFMDAITAAPPEKFEKIVDLIFKDNVSESEFSEDEGTTKAQFHHRDSSQVSHLPTLSEDVGTSVDTQEQPITPAQRQIEEKEFEDKDKTIPKKRVRHERSTDEDIDKNDEDSKKSKKKMSNSDVKEKTKKIDKSSLEK